MAIIETVTSAASASAAKAASAALFAEAANRINKMKVGSARAVIIKALASLEGYKRYIEETNDRVKTFKTFADPTKPVSLLDHFVKTNFQISRGQKIFDQEELIARLKRPCRYVISATAGFGKSMVMRYIALCLYQNPTGRIPIFVELRQLNRLSVPSLLTYIHTSYRSNTDVQVEAFNQGLSAGVFVLILDGFDEISHEIRKRVEDEILLISRQFPSCSIIVSGRPDDRFKSWRDFSMVKILPMKRTQVIELIDKLDYDKGVRKRFVSKIKNGLYESHESFLSTPLLAILMLLTFEQNANIPDKMHLFYGEAFRTLFHKHDALKEQYDRSRRSGLSVDEFERAFSVFCLKTYVQEKTEFSYSEIKDSVKQALNFEDIHVKPDDFLFDLEETVCLLMKEGSSFFFIHRSFQEYFTAVFLARCAEKLRDDFLTICATRPWDNVLPMLFDMASAQIEPTWVARNCKKYLDEVGLDDGKTHPALARFNGLILNPANGKVAYFGFDPGPFAHFISVMRRFYSSISSATLIDFDILEDWVKNNSEEVARHRSGDRPFSIFPLSAFPNDVLKASRVLKFAIEEWDSIKTVNANIDHQQRLKLEYLNQLFAISE